MSASALSPLFNYVRYMPKAGKFKDFLPLVKSSAVGGLFSGGLTTLFTGNPLAGLAVGAADTLGSAALATGIGALGGKTGTRKVFGKDINFRGGKKYTFSESDNLDPLLKQLQATPAGLAPSKDDAMRSIASYIKSKEYYSPSGPQLAGMYAGSIAAPFAIEPLFYPQNQNNIVQQQLRQRLGYSQTLTNPQSAQNALQEITLMDEASGLGEAGRQLTSNLAPGTLYQYPNFGVNTMGVM